MPDFILETQGLTKYYDALCAVDHVSLSVERGSLHAVIGPNGAGKTTLLGQILGELRPDAGRVIFTGADITHKSVPRRVLDAIGCTYQRPSLCPAYTALQNVALSVQTHGGHGFQFWPTPRRNAADCAAAEQWLRRV